MNSGDITSGNDLVSTVRAFRDRQTCTTFQTSSSSFRTSLPPPSLHPSISHSPFPLPIPSNSCRRHYTFVLAALSACPSVRESHENRFVRKVQIRTCNAARKGRKGGGHLQMKTASTYLPKWRPQRRCKDAMARPSAAANAITHITMGRDSEKRDAGRLDVLRPGSLCVGS